MDERIIGFHTLSRQYFIEVIERSRNALMELFQNVNKEGSDLRNEKITYLLKDFYRKNPYCQVKKDIC